LLNKKVLIWYRSELLKRNGGPSTYLYNLKQYVDEHNLSIDFLSEMNLESDKINQESKSNSNQSLFYKIYNLFIPFFIRNIFWGNVNLIKYLIDCKTLNIQLYNQIDVNQYDIIHFHTVKEFYKTYPLLTNYEGKVALTIHSPVPYYVELVQNFLDRKIFSLPFLIKKLRNIDEYAIKKADVIIIPTEYSFDSYSLYWKGFNDIIKNKNIAYVLTGIPEEEIKADKNTIRKQLNIPDNALMLLYVGRHNRFKGYDILKKIGKEVLAKYNDVYIIVCGKEDPLKGLNHERWKEVGWTEDPHSYINACDIFILPNKDTFFDLILLEVMSLGKTVMLSNTGGNKHFYDLNNSSMYFFNYHSINNILDTFDTLYNQKSKLEKYSKINYENYILKYTLDKFGQNYTELYNNL
jgi:glycosyltransferase involved in cell wall biosynthesis